MYITSLSVDDCEYYLAISFSSTQTVPWTVLYIIKPRNMTTLNTVYGLPTLLYSYKTNLLV